MSLFLIQFSSSDRGAVAVLPILPLCSRYPTWFGNGLCNDISDWKIRDNAVTDCWPPRAPKDHVSKYFQPIAECWLACMNNATQNVRTVSRCNLKSYKKCPNLNSADLRAHCGPLGNRDSTQSIAHFPINYSHAFLAWHQMPCFRNTYERWKTKWPRSTSKTPQTKF